ncbi:MAG: chain-length determining protein, partial [Deltaproteobacteria bacterium]|nr:chain-length determining protein [Deltaproteobacteria bacterium]
IEQLRAHIRMVWRYRWIALGAATVICVVGWVAVMMLPNKYGVSTKVFLDTSTLLRPLLKGLAVSDRSRRDSVTMMRRTLLARPNIESVARSTDMDLKAKTPEEFESLITGLAKRIKVTGGIAQGRGKNNIFEISYDNADPQLAMRVVETLLNIFVENSLGESRKDSSKTKEFLDQQIQEYKSRLQAAEARLKEFKQRNVGLMPGEGSSYYTKRAAMAEQLAEATLQLEEAKRRRDELQRQITDEDEEEEEDEEESLLGLGPSTSVLEVAGPLDGRILNVEER